MWQAIGGIAYDVSYNVDLFAEYHYRDLRNGPNDPAVPYAAHNLTENAVMAGFRWYPQSAPEAVAYQPPPPPPPMPPPPPAPVKTFIVFFDFNKSDLTSEAQNVVAEAVKTAGQTNAVRIVVTGHTDTVGSDTYNQALSIRRAETVKNEMIREGMKADEISTVGKSFHDPLVATGSGVREPQNRRAVIDLG
jgi:outer membrane protein OmpA-like peptidoglycan-associated protein